SEIYIKAESNLSVNNGRLGSNFTIFPKGNFYVEDGTNTKITLENTDMGSMGDKWGIADYCPAAISIVSDISGTVNTWADTLRPTTLKNRNNSVYLGENTSLKINNGAAREAYASAIEIQNSGGSIELAKNAELFINIEKDSEEDKAGQTPVAFDKESASFILGENAKFDLCIGSQQDGNQSSGTAIKFDGKDSNIQLSQASSFTVKSNSDYDQGILNFSGVNSKINVDNEAIFDLEYLKNSSQPLLRMSEGLVSIPATGNYKHTIKEWSANNFDESSPDMMAQPLDKTSFKVKNTTFSDVTTTADQSIEKLFIDNFTNAAQKMVIEPLNYSVSLDPISNETKSKYVVTGDAIPSNGSIELTGGSFDLLPTSERTVSVNDDGSFKWEGALTTPFNAGDKIVASYVGSENSGETIVVDKTKPSGKTKVYDIDEGEKIPAAIDFIESVEDNNPTDSTINDFTYSFIDKVILPDDVAKISNGKDEQDYIGHIKITDKAGNDSKDIEVKMIVHKVQNGGNENNGTGSTKDLRLDYVPSEFNFGMVNTSATSTIKNANILNGDNRQWIQISDDRTNEEGWKVKASISDFSSTNSTDTLKGTEIVIPDGNSFNKKTANQTNPKG
ncbi:MAG: WxL domain-containing protein, partial [Erysipelotrichaceae bacterium]